MENLAKTSYVEGMDILYKNTLSKVVRPSIVLEHDKVVKDIF